jgi:hypothetical protein
MVPLLDHATSPVVISVPDIKKLHLSTSLERKS